MRLSASILKAVALVVLLAVRARAQGMYISTAVAAEHAMAKLTEDLAEMRKASIDSKKAEEIRARVSGPEGINTKFINAMTELHDEKAKLMVNKEKNAAEIARLEEAEKRAEGVRTKLKKLQSLTADDRTLIGAVKSGTLQRIAAEASAAMKDTASAVADVSGQVTASGDDKPGSIEIKKIDVKRGKLRFFVSEAGGAEKEVFEGSTIRITKLPVSLRASIQDSEKVRLDQQWGGGAATWDPKPSAPGPAHHYAYEGQGGRSEWTAHEEYHWTAGDNRDRLRSLGQRNSDDATQKSTGDVVELVPAKPVAQAIGLDVEAKSLRWERKSKLPGGERKADVTAKDAAASAHLTVSFFPAGN